MTEQGPLVKDSSSTRTAVKVGKLVLRQSATVVALSGTILSLTLSPPSSYHLYPLIKEELGLFSFADIHRRLSQPEEISHRINFIERGNETNQKGVCKKSQHWRLLPAAISLMALNKWEATVGSAAAERERERQNKKRPKGKQSAPVADNSIQPEGNTI